MKILSTFILVLFMAKGCNNSSSESKSELQKESKNITFEYEANTRGSYLKRVVKEDGAYATIERGGSLDQKSLSKTDWDALLTIASKVDVAKIQDLKAPSDARFYDGAKMANLRVIYNEKTYESATFDHGNPPAEIKDLVNKILEVSNPDAKKDDN